MTTIANHPFSTNSADFWASYSRGRLRVPLTFWSLIWDCHQSHGNATFEHIHDLGSGPGIHASVLASKFSNILFSDPNPLNMEMAQAHIKQTRDDGERFSYRVGRGEDITNHVDEKGVFDMVIAFNSLHWMDAEKCLPAIASSLKPNGTFAAALYGFPDVYNEEAKEVLMKRFRHGINAIMTDPKGAPPLFEYGILSQDCGYDCISMGQDLWKNIQRVKLNYNDGERYKGFGSDIRGKRADVGYESAITPEEKVVRERDMDWYFKTDLNGLRDILDSFPFPKDTEYETRMWKELDSIYKGKVVEGLYKVDLILGQKR